MRDHATPDLPAEGASDASAAPTPPTAPTPDPEQREQSACDTLLAPLEAAGDAATPGQLLRVARRVAAAPGAVRALAHPRLRARCTTAPLAHVVFTAFADLPDEAEPYLRQGLSLPPESRSLLAPWTHGNVLYTLGCVAARAGQTERALGYVRQALAVGESIRQMARDSDYSHLWGHPEFEGLKG